MCNIYFCTGTGYMSKASTKNFLILFFFPTKEEGGAKGSREGWCGMMSTCASEKYVTGATSYCRYLL